MTNDPGVSLRVALAQAHDEIARLKRVIERDRSKANDVLNALRRAVGRRSWLREAGRGSYAYDDERYQQEFGAALDELDCAIDPLSRYVSDWTDCPTDPGEIAKARKGL